MSSDVLVHSAEDATDLKTIPRRRTGRLIGAVAVLALLALIINSLVQNPRMEWGVVREYFLSDVVLSGLYYTLLLTLIIMLIGIVLGVLLAVMRQSANPVLSGVAQVYVWIFRSVPPLVQLLIWYNLAAVYPTVSLKVPFGPELFSGTANDYITPFVAALLGLGLNEGAYMCEIIRSGINSVDEGQTEAAQSLGFTSGRTMRRVVLPQAIKIIVPPTGNEVITVIKATSLVSIISMTDLLYSVQLVYSKTFQNIPLLVVACLWYLIVTSILTVGQYFLERHLGRGGSNSVSGPSLLRRLSRNFTTLRTKSDRTDVEDMRGER